VALASTAAEDFAFRAWFGCLVCWWSRKARRWRLATGAARKSSWRRPRRCSRGIGRLAPIVICSCQRLRQ